MNKVVNPWWKKLFLSNFGYFGGTNYRKIIIFLNKQTHVEYFEGSMRGI